MDYKIPFGFTDLSVNGLIYACYYKDLELLREQLAKGVDPNSVDPDGVSAIAHAANEKVFSEGVQLLLNAGADPTQMGKRFPYSAIVAAASFGHVEILELFRQQLADGRVLASMFPCLYPSAAYEFLRPLLVECRVKVTGAQLSLAASASASRNAVTKVLDFLPIEIDYVDEEGRSPLHIYVMQTVIDSAIVERLLLAGCNPNLRDQSGSTVLKLLINSEHSEECRMEKKKSCRAIRRAGGKYAVISSVGDLFKSILF